MFSNIKQQAHYAKITKILQISSFQKYCYLSKLLSNTLGNERATRASNNHTFTLIKTNTIYFSNSFPPNFMRLGKSLNMQ